MNSMRRLTIGLATLLVMVSAAQAQRRTTYPDETRNNTSGCLNPISSYVGATSCQADFPGANDDASAGNDRNAGANTIAFDAAPSNLGDFSHDGVDIHNLV